MVLYFTGTGNSRHVARIIAKELNDELVDITPFLKENKTGDFISDKPYVFVVPTYSSYLPLIVQKFIEDSTFSGNKDVYLLLTCGASAAKPGVAKRFGQLCQKISLRFMGVEQVVMPENYITLFFAPSEKTASEIIAKAERKLPSAIEKIKKGETLRVKGRYALTTYLVNPIFYKLLVTDKPYYATDACVACGKCVSVCPLNNITLNSDKPMWHGNCTQCMACISQCPTLAIEYGKKAKGKRRYYLP